MKKIYIIDTNILIHSPEAIFNFQDNDVVIPIAVIEELDSLKNADGEKGVNVRGAIRYIEKLRLEGNLLEGVRTKSCGIVRIEKNYVNIELPQDLPDSKMDNRILKVCIDIKNDNKDMSVILVTKDILLRIKAQILDIQAQDYTTDQAPEEEKQYTGRKEIFVEEDAFKEFKKKVLNAKMYIRLIIMELEN